MLGVILNTAGNFIRCVMICLYLKNELICNKCLCKQLNQNFVRVVVGKGENTVLFCKSNIIPPLIYRMTHHYHEIIGQSVVAITLTDLKP